MTIIMKAILILIFCLCLWDGVKAQCSDPILHKLSDIHQQIAECNAQIANLTSHFTAQINELKEKLDDVKVSTITEHLANEILLLVEKG